MALLGQALAALETVNREALLFAGAGFLVGGIDDVALDLAYLWHRLSRRPGLAERSDATPDAPIAIFVPAWDEADVIGRMLRSALAAIRHPHYRIYVGLYANDPSTIADVPRH